MNFGISIVKNPVFVWDERRKCKVLNWNESQGDHTLDFELEGKDFNEIHKIVDVSFLTTERLEDESYDDYDKRMEERYLKAVSKKGYEMLGRIRDWYADAIYFSSEVNRLREECLKIKNMGQDEDAIIALDKLLIACNEALKTDSGICFGSD